MLYKRLLYLSSSLSKNKNKKNYNQRLSSEFHPLFYSAREMSQIPTFSARNHSSIASFSSVKCANSCGASGFHAPSKGMPVYLYFYFFMVLRMTNVCCGMIMYSAVLSDFYVYNNFPFLRLDLVVLLECIS